MKIISEALVEIHEHNQPDYKPLVDFQSWRVALINYTAELLPGKITQMQKHSETDEVFVLLTGKCILFLGEGAETITGIHAVDMEPFKLYNVKRNAWHSHTFSEDARVLIVENKETTVDNSPITGLSPQQTLEIVTLTKNLWS